MNCLFHEIDVVDDNGDVHLETLFNTVPGTVRNQLINMAKDCEHPEGDTLCHKAWWFHQCWKKADPVVCRTDTNNCLCLFSNHIFPFSIISYHRALNAFMSVLTKRFAEK